MYLLLDGATEEALRITATVRVRTLVTGAAGVAGLPPRLQHAHQNRMSLAQLCAARHIEHHSLASKNHSLDTTRHHALTGRSTARVATGAADGGLCGRCGARRTVTRATYLPAADPPEKVRVPRAPAPPCLAPRARS